MRKLVTGTNLESDYHGCGKIWIAMNANNDPQGFRYMGDHPHLSGGSDDALSAANRVRRCPASERKADEMNTESFLAHRAKSREELRAIAGENGTVVSGNASCCEIMDW